MSLGKRTGISFASKSSIPNFLAFSFCFSVMPFGKSPQSLTRGLTASSRINCPFTAMSHPSLSEAKVTFSFGCLSDPATKTLQWIFYQQFVWIALLTCFIGDVDLHKIKPGKRRQTRELWYWLSYDSGLSLRGGAGDFPRLLRTWP